MDLFSSGSHNLTSITATATEVVVEVFAWIAANNTAIFQIGAIY